jgi:hypothetical protein
VTDNGLASIAKLSSLRILELELSASQRRHLQPGGITNQGLAAMSSLEGLLELNLSGNPRINSLGARPPGFSEAMLGPTHLVSGLETCVIVNVIFVVMNIVSITIIIMLGRPEILMLLC